MSIENLDYRAREEDKFFVQKEKMLEIAGRDIVGHFC